MIKLIHCEISGLLIGYETETLTVIFEWVDGKRIV